MLTGIYRDEGTLENWVKEQHGTCRIEEGKKGVNLVGVGACKSHVSRI